MSYPKEDIKRLECEQPRLWLRIVSERLSTVRYVFVVTIEDGLPTVAQRAALEYADAMLIGWPQPGSRDVQDIPDGSLDSVAADIETIEKYIDEFRQGEKNGDADTMAEDLNRISECVGNVRKVYQPDFPLPTYVEVRRYVEKEWNNDMDQIESGAREYLNMQDQGIASEQIVQNLEADSGTAGSAVSVTSTNITQAPMGAADAGTSGDRAEGASGRAGKGKTHNG
ncbi:hypothetical protein [Scardovia wiggsiae]|uniref:hypothetical protein n=1 Tax=Scardovia wiggsiae TaxID=230143 RepID=UPI00361D1A4C